MRTFGARGLGLSLLLAPAEASLKKECRRRCRLAVSACGTAETCPTALLDCYATRGRRPAKCRTILRKRCVQGGVSVCETTTTSTTVTTTTQLAMLVTTTSVGVTFPTSTTTLPGFSPVGNWSFTGAPRVVDCDPNGIAYPVTAVNVSSVGLGGRLSGYFDPYGTRSVASGYLGTRGWSMDSRYTIGRCTFVDSIAVAEFGETANAVTVSRGVCGDAACHLEYVGFVTRR